MGGRLRGGDEAGSWARTVSGLRVARARQAGRAGRAGLRRGLLAREGAGRCGTGAAWASGEGEAGLRGGECNTLV